MMYWNGHIVSFFLHGPYFLDESYWKWQNFDYLLRKFKIDFLNVNETGNYPLASPRDIWMVLSVVLGIALPPLSLKDIYFALRRLRPPKGWLLQVLMFGNRLLLSSPLCYPLNSWFKKVNTLESVVKLVEIQINFNKSFEEVMLTFAALWSVSRLLVLNNSLVNYPAVYYLWLGRQDRI